MRKEMGHYHSSLSCERISKSLHNCFGLKTSRTYETESNGVKNLSGQPLQNDNCSLGSHNDIAVSQPKRKVSRKSHRSSREAYCCKGCDADQDGFSYDVCNQSADSQVNPRLPNTPSAPSVTQSRRHSGCLHEQKSGGDVLAVSKAANATNRLTCMDAIVEPKATIVEVNGKEILVKTVTNTKRSDENLSRNARNFMNNHKVNADEIILPNNSSVKSDESVHDRTKSIEKTPQQSDNVISTVAHSKQGEEVMKKSVVDVDYFRNLINTETDRLNQSIERWNKILLGGNSHCPTEVCDEIRTVIGQTRLVTSERFTQFSKLVDRAEGRATPSADHRPVLISDLQGFWDMIYFQVQDVDAKFDSLDKLRENKWKSSDSSPREPRKTSVKTTQRKAKSAPRKQPAKKKAPSSEEDRKRREAARKRLAEARKALAQRNQPDQDVLAVVEAPVPDNPQTNSVGDTRNNHTKEELKNADSNSSTKRPDSIVDALSCAVTINQVTADNTSLSSMSSTSMVH